jgi:pimeloyl-ACP methyl ester carboxylesterase
LADYLELAFELPPFEDHARFRASSVAGSLALKHGEGVRALIAMGLGVSAAVLLRAQYEAVLRCVWICYVAEDDQIQLLERGLSAEAELGAKVLPQANDMLKGIERAAPAAASQSLKNFRTQSWSALNSFVHAGAHAISRHRDGLPLKLAEGALRSSNGLSVLAAMQCAVATGSQDLVRRVGLAQRAFVDCLPKLDA